MIGALAIRTRRSLVLQRQGSNQSDTGGSALSPTPIRPIRPIRPTPAANTINTSTASRAKHYSCLYMAAGVAFVTGFVLVVPALLGAHTTYFLASGALMVFGMLVLIIACCMSDDPDKIKNEQEMKTKPLITRQSSKTHPAKSPTPSQLAGRQPSLTPSIDTQSEVIAPNNKSSTTNKRHPPLHPSLTVTGRRTLTPLSVTPQSSNSLDVEANLSPTLAPLDLSDHEPAIGKIMEANCDDHLSDIDECESPVSMCQTRRSKNIETFSIEISRESSQESSATDIQDIRHSGGKTRAFSKEESLSSMTNNQKVSPPFQSSISISEVITTTDSLRDHNIDGKGPNGDKTETGSLPLVST